MLISVQVAALFVIVPVLLLPASLQWSEPTKLRETSGYLTLGPRITAVSDGHAAVIWREINRDQPTEQYLLVRTLTPGSGWSPATVISDGSGSLGSPAAIAMSGDGTAIAAWRQVVSESLQTQVLARKFVPGVGWGPAQVLSTATLDRALQYFSSDPVLAFARDGRAHIVFYESSSWVAKTLAPGEDVWSATTVLGEAKYGEDYYYINPVTLVAGDDAAYAAFNAYGFISDQFVSTAKLATYTPDGWQPGSLVSRAGWIVSGALLIANAGHVVLSWSESRTGQQDLVQWVQRLTGPPAQFAVPFAGFLFGTTPSSCRIDLSSDGTVLATCVVGGNAIPGCSSFSFSGPRIQFFYSYVEMYRHPLEGDWLNPEIVSDVQNRSGLSKVTADSLGDIVALWSSNIPCISNITEYFTRIWNSATASWEPEMRLANVASAPDLTVDNRGTFRLLWTDEGIRDGQFSSTLLTAELVTHAQPVADVNRDGVVDCADLSLVRASLGKRVGEPGLDARADTNQDGVVDVKDLAFVAQQLPPGTQCP